MKFPRHIIFAAILAAVSCSTHNATDIFDDVRYRPGFAEGFEIDAALLGKRRDHRRCRTVKKS